MEPEILNKYGNRVRVRVSGLCWKTDKLLMVNHKGLTKGSFWAPPGGGIEFTQTAIESLIREFQEETALAITVGQFQFACEFIKHPLHAIELFFEVIYTSGDIHVGIDPESEKSSQIIREVSWLNFNEIMAIPEDERHGIFRFAETPSQLKKLSGFYRI